MEAREIGEIYMAYEDGDSDLYSYLPIEAQLFTAEERINERKCSGMSYAGKVIEKAQHDRLELAKEYGVPVSSIVWMGDNKYIVIKDGQEIHV